MKTLADHGRNGWSVTLLADRHVRWRTPSGHTTITEPEGRDYLFPTHEPGLAPAAPSASPAPTELEQWLRGYRTPPATLARLDEGLSTIETELHELLDWHNPPDKSDQPEDPGTTDPGPPPF